MKNKVKNIIIGCTGLILMACPPNTGDTITGETSSGVSSSSAGSNSQSETTVEQQVTTSGNPSVTETLNTENSSSNTSGEFDTIVMTITTDTNCGDGIIDFSEECDDGNTIAEDKCDDHCFKTRFAFRSFEQIPSNFGGTVFADGLCAMNAQRAKLKGEYKAWISDSDLFSAPEFRFNSTDFQGWYLLPTDPPKKLARGWKGLTTDFLVNWIDVSAAGVESILTPEFVWTGTLQDGTFSEGNTCNGWTSVNGFDTALVGSIGELFDGKWTNFQQEICTRNIERKIYCFQVI